MTRSRDPFAGLPSALVVSLADKDSSIHPNDAEYVRIDV